jgi:hypothetical protein
MTLLSHQGWTAAAIAGLLGCDPTTVRRWIHRYNQDGVIGLADRPRAGRPRLGSPRLGERIVRPAEGIVGSQGSDMTLFGRLRRSHEHPCNAADRSLSVHAVLVGAGPLGDEHAETVEDAVEAELQGPVPRAVPAGGGHGRGDRRVAVAVGTQQLGDDGIQLLLGVALGRTSLGLAPVGWLDAWTLGYLLAAGLLAVPAVAAITAAAHHRHPPAPKDEP